MLTQLQAAIDQSHETASLFTRTLFEETWDAQQVQQFINQVRNLTVASTLASGHPHAAVVISVCVDGEIYFTVSPRSALSRNLTRDNHIAFTVCDSTHAVMGRCHAIFVTAALDDPDLIRRLAAATPKGAFTPDGWDGHVYRIEIERIFAN
jgi:hypothetical protein